MAKKAVHFGAGNIGRGFVACILNKSGYEVVFADVVEDLVNSINENKTYDVIEVGAEGKNVETISNYRAINSRKNEDDVINEIATAAIVTCSVGPNILGRIAPTIAKGIDKRDENDKNLPPLAVIACENVKNATTKLAEFIGRAAGASNVRYANSAIDRIVPAQEPDAGLTVKLEKFYEWVVDKTPFPEDDDILKIDSIHWVDNLEPYIERKLFTVNTGHATAAYYGYNRKKRTVDEALQDEFIMAQVRKALEETSELIVTKHGIAREDQKEYMEKIITRISNPHLADAVERVGRAPIRKLGRDDRLLAPARELAEKGKDVTALLDAAEMAFRFQNVEGDDDSEKLGKMFAENSADEIVVEVTGLKPSETLYDRLVEVVKKVKGQ